MLWFKNLKVSAKLLIGFIFVSSITLVVGFFGFSRLDDISDLRNVLASKQTPSILYMGNINSSINAMAVCERGLLNDDFTKRNIRQPQYKVFYERYEIAKQAIMDYEALNLSKEEIETWNTFSEAFSKWTKRSEMFIALNKEKDELLSQGIQLSETSIQDLNTKILDTYLSEREDFLTASETLVEIINNNWKQISVSNEDALAIQISSIFWIIFITILGFIIAILLGLFISKLITKPLHEAFDVISELSLGSLRKRMSWNTKDEFGEMKEKLNHFVDFLEVYVNSIYDTAKGDFSYVRKINNEKNELAPALEKIVDTLNELKNETDVMIEKYHDGHTDYAGDASKFEGGYKTIVEGFNKSVFTIIDVVRKGSETLSKIAEGDLTARMKGDFKNNFANYQNQINSVGESLENVVSRVNEAVALTQNAGNQISSASEEMAAGAHEQSSQAGEIATAVEEMTATIFDTSKNAENATKNAQNAGKVANEGGQVVSETVNGIMRIADVVKESADKIQSLGNSSNQIGAIIQVIDDIADQTNLLALNAAIEAARAGEQGRGFAVVADEVRKLAERTTKATKEIAVMIKQIQEDTQGAVESMEVGTSEVENGKVMANKAGEVLQQIITGADEVVGIITQVAAASQQQSTTAEEISKNIEAISSVIQQSAAGTQEIATAAEDLNQLTEGLGELISQFKISKAQNQLKSSNTAYLLEN